LGFHTAMPLKERTEQHDYPVMPSIRAHVPGITGH